MAKLKIYTDENVDVRIAEGLKRRGIKVFSVIEKGQVGIADMEHFQYATKIQAVIFTHDHHFLKSQKRRQKNKKSLGSDFCGNE